MELIPYTETRRDRLEQELAAAAAKPEIHSERRHGLQITVYYLRQIGEVSMALLLDGNSTTREFHIPNDRVNDAIAHPEHYAWRAGLPRETNNG